MLLTTSGAEAAPGLAEPLNALIRQRGAGEVLFVSNKVIRRVTSEN